MRVPSLNRRRFLLTVSTLAAGVAGPSRLAAADEEISDDLLYDRVNQVLITDRELGTRQLKVVVQDGVVTVSGRVETEKLKKKVDKVVKKVKGVKKVVNEVEVRI